MISIQVDQLTKRFGSTVALHQLDLRIEPGELFFLLGPSGCGKTTLLRSLAGFYQCVEGRIRFGEEDVTRLEPHRRNAGMMFQNYALWPHLTVAQNVAFGLVERKVPRSEIDRRVGEALDSVQMGACAERSPHQLSGGQQQRVALARALVIRPKCLLLDEPLSNLDAQLRLDLRTEIRRVCKKFALTTVYVTHDQKEALSISDRMAILEDGHILQVGGPQEVYRRPRRKTVAHFMGATDLIPGTLESRVRDEATVNTAMGRFHGFLGDPVSPPAAGSAVTLSIRPECWTLQDHGADYNCVSGRIGHSVYLGEVAQYEFMTGEHRFKIYEMNPRDGVRADRPGWHAQVAPCDVVVLTD